MTRRQELLDLIARIIGSYAIAALTVGIFFGLLLGIISTAISSPQDGGVLSTALDVAFMFLFYGALAAVMTAGFAFVPFVAAIMVLRALGLRGWVWHGLAGLLVSAVVAALLPHQPYRPAIETFALGFPIILLGSVAGLAYWAAFNWLSRRDIARGSRS